jgi:hypothetical protein
MFPYPVPGGGVDDGEDGDAGGAGSRVSAGGVAGARFLEAPAFPGVFFAFLTVSPFFFPRAFFFAF